MTLHELIHCFSPQVMVSGEYPTNPAPDAFKKETKLCTDHWFLNRPRSDNKHMLFFFSKSERWVQFNEAFRDVACSQQMRALIWQWAPLSDT